MAITRRGFLQKGSMVGIAAMVPGVLNSIAFAQENNEAPKDPYSKALGKLSRVDFQGQMNTSFRFSIKDRSDLGARSKWVETELINVMDLRTSFTAEEDGVELFALLFHGPADLALPQGTYTVKHDVFGKFRLFVVPASKTEKGLKYEALFNRIRPTG